MSLQKKFFIMIAVTFSALILVLYVAARLEVIKHFNDFEKMLALQDAQRTRELLVNEQAQLQLTLLDYAMWDEACAFLQGKAPRFLKENLTESSLARLRLSLAVFVTTGSQVRQCIAFDLKTRKMTNAPGGLEAYIRPGSPLLLPLGASDATEGIVKLSSGLMLVSAHPIVKTDGSGPSHGWLIFGRPLDDTMVQQFRNISKLDIDLVLVESPASTPADPKQPTPASRQELTSHSIDGQNVIGAAQLSELNGRPVAELHVKLNRAFFDRSQDLIDSLIQRILVIGIAFSFLIAILIKKMFLNRVTHLHKELARITRSGTPSERIGVPGNDEVQELAGEINKMLAALMASSMALSQSEERMRLSLAGSNVGAWDWNVPADQVVMFNHWFEILGYGATDPATHMDILKECVHPDDLPGLNRTLTDVFTGEVSHLEEEFRVRAATGEWRWFLVRGRVFGRDENNRPLRLVGLHLDVTARRRAQNELRRVNDSLEARVNVRTIDLALTNAALRKEVAERQRAEAALCEAARRKDEFLAMLAHELRNPLAPIRSAVQVFQLAGDNVTMKRRQWEIIDRQISHMAHLLDDLLDVSRITQGKIRLEKNAIDLGRLVDGALETMQSQAQEHGHTLLYQRPSETLWIEGDPDRMAQVMCNLIQNAIKYTERQGTIQIAVRREFVYDNADPQVSISVKDTGIGIAPDLLPHVFDLFMQADHSLDRTQGGLGIGLTLVHRLVLLHDGSVQALSEGLGRGSEFIIRLPLLGEAPAGMGGAEPTGQLTATLAPPGDGDAMPGRKVLMVDDNSDTACSMSELLELWGFQVRVAFDGPAAIETALAFEPDIVLLDIGLPGMSGYDVARCLRQKQEFASLMLVALTGYSQDEDRQLAREAGFNQFCTKPVDLHELRNVLESYEAVEPAECREE